MKFPRHFAVSLPMMCWCCGFLAPLLLLAGCSTQRERSKDVELATGTSHHAGSAIDSDYLVRRGASLTADFANGCRFYVEAGGRFRGLAHGVRHCTVYAEKGAKIERREGIRVVRVEDARRAFADRDKPVVEKPVPIVDSGSGVLSTSSGGSYHRHDDDDDDSYQSRRPSRIRDVKISKSSYKKKSN